MDLMPKSPDLRRNARALFWMGWQVTDIADHLGIPRTTVESWKGRDGWSDAQAITRIESCIEAKLISLVLKEPKTGADVRDIDLLARQIERLARVRRYGEPGGHEGDLNPAIGERNRKNSKNRPVKNHFTDEQAAKLIALFEGGLFDYQKFWAAAGQERSRVILKSRQIGATYYFAREALVDAIKTGRNQIFLSASKAQAHVFRQYIVAFAKEVEVELTGDPIVLSNGAILYFLGTNARTAQGYHGNFYFDEFFWTFRFTELEKVASGMALHKKWRKTYFSTPSSVSHQAYPFWTGEAWNKKRSKVDRLDIDVSHSALRDGLRGPDRKWRHIVTIEDAQRGGCDLFDIDELREEYTADQFANLLMCEFIDDNASVFPLEMLQRCMVDSVEEWEDVDWRAMIEGGRPYGDRPVWLGYDPSHTGDRAALVVIAPPARPGAKFRLLEKHQWRGMDFAAQAKAIKDICARYAVAYIGIDATGMGLGVYQLVQQFYPGARAITYSPEVKTRMVLKAHDTISRGRFEMDAGAIEVAQSFMAIRKSVTNSGRAVTYEAGRTEETGHADVAWAVMHAFDHEPLTAASGQPRSSRMEFF